MSTKLIATLALVLVLGGIGVYLLTTKTSTERAAESKEFRIVIRGGAIVEGPTTLEVHEGDPVGITIHSDTVEEFHLHGYDRSVDLMPNEDVQLSFLADASGRFIFELEKSKVELGSLIVLP